MTREDKIDLLRRQGADPDVARMIASVLQRTKMVQVGDLPDAEIDLLVELADAMEAQLGGGSWIPGGERGE